MNALKFAWKRTKEESFICYARRTKNLAGKIFQAIADERKKETLPRSLKKLHD